MNMNVVAICVRITFQQQRVNLFKGNEKTLESGLCLNMVNVFMEKYEPFIGTFF